MGWLDFLAPALLGAVVGRRTRRACWPRAAVAAAALAWGLLLEVTSPDPRHRPVLAGLAVYVAGVVAPQRVRAARARRAARYRSRSRMPART